MNFIVDELYSLAEAVKGRWGDKDFVEQKGAVIPPSLYPRAKH